MGKLSQDSYNIKLNTLLKDPSIGKELAVVITSDEVANSIKNLLQDLITELRTEPIVTSAMSSPPPLRQTLALQVQSVIE